MGALRTLATIVLSISFVVFIALFGRLPAFRKTPIGLLHRLLMVHIPHVLAIIDDRISGRRITSSLHRFFDYVMNEPHPLVMIFFILLQFGSEILFIPPILKHISLYPHLILIPLVVAAPYITLYLSHTVRSTVTAANHADTVRAYPYDYILYHPNLPCKTCHFPKPARSKHCSICNVCVQRQDHHCIWINNCVSRNNYKWFIALLLSMSVILLYASMLGYTVLNQVLQERFVPAELTRGSQTTKKWSTKLTWWAWLDAWGLAIALHPRIGAITLLATFTFPLATAFLAYHTYILWAGVTTNESSKWADLRDDIDDDLVWKARLDETRAEYDEHSMPSLSATSYNKSDPSSRTLVSASDTDAAAAADRQWAQTHGANSTAQWWIIRTASGLQPVRQKWAGDPGEHEPDLRWTRVRSIADVINIYDLGFRGNLIDSFCNTE